MANLHEQSVNAALERTLLTAGFTDNKRLATTLQESKVAIKVTNRQLCDRHVAVWHGKSVSVHEDALKERSILQYLTKKQQDVPNSLVKYLDFFKSNLNFYLVMEYGGLPLFDFVVKVHEYIQAGKLDIAEWHKLAKLIFAQMLESVEYMHRKNVCHLDISLENFLISDVEVILMKDGKIKFFLETPQNVQVKLCDFGLAEVFDPELGFYCTKFCGKTVYKSPEVTNQKRFNAKSNDVWCLGICFFLLLIGSQPWQSATQSDIVYAQFMKPNGLREILKSWNRLQYVNDDMVELIQAMLQCEKNRATLDDLKKV